MKLTNKYQLPSTLVNLAKRDPYSKGKADFSATQLIDSPKISILQEEHDNEMVMDVTDSMWALVGRALHNVCEGGAGDHHIVEERLFMLVDDYIVSGGIDVQEDVGKAINIYDYKFTGVWSVMKQKTEWEQQLNIYAQLVRSSKGREIGNLYIVAVLRDWNRHKAGYGGYPEAPVVVVPIRKWSSTEAIAYIKARVRLHAYARKMHEDGNKIPPCTPFDQWKRETMYAAKKPKASRAIRVFDNLPEAKNYVDKRNGLVLETRPGACVRCEDNWCRVRDWCDQWQEIKKEKDAN